MINITDLTDQEFKVLEGLAMGKSNKEIAQEMNLALVTVKVHLANMKLKLKITQRVLLAVFAYKHHVVNLNDIKL